MTSFQTPAGQALRDANARDSSVRERARQQQRRVWQWVGGDGGREYVCTDAVHDARQQRRCVSAGENVPDHRVRAWLLMIVDSSRKYVEYSITRYACIRLLRRKKASTHNCTPRRVTRQ